MVYYRCLCLTGPHIITSRKSAKIKIPFLTWKTESKSTSNQLFCKAHSFDKITHAFGNVIEKGLTGTLHAFDWNSINLRIHFDLFIGNIDKQNTEVGSTKIQGNKSAIFVASGK